MIEVGFIGCGRIAHHHIKVLQHLGVRVTSVCGRKNSPNVKAFSEKYKISRIYDCWQDQLKAEKPDAYWVLVSWDEIEYLLIPFIRSGIPCFFEKPIALSSEKIDEALRVQDTYKTKMLVGYNRRFYDFIPDAKKFITNHKLLAGEIHVHEAIKNLIAQREYKKIRNLLFYNSSHLFDLLYFLIGDVEPIYIFKKMDNKLKTITSYNGILVSRKYNIPIHLLANWDCPANFGITFYCENYVLKISPLEKMVIYHDMKIIAQDEQHPVRIFQPKLIKESYVDTKYKPGFLSQAKNCIETCVLNKYENKIGATLNDTLTITNLCEKLLCD